MAKKLTYIFLVFSLLLSITKSGAMDLKQYTVPICIGACCAFATLFFFLKKDHIVAQLGPNDTNIDYFIGEEDSYVKEEYSKLIDKGRLPELYKICKEAMNSCHSVTIYQNNYLPKINELISYWIHEFKPSFKSQMYRDQGDKIYPDKLHKKILYIFYLLSCKFNDPDLLNNVLNISTVSRFCDDVLDRCISISNLYQHHDSLNQLANLPIKYFMRNDSVLNECKKQQQILKNKAHVTTDDQKIIEENLRRIGWYENVNLVANFFETKLWQVQNNQDPYQIDALIIATLQDKIDTQLPLLIVAIKNRYILLEQKLLQLFNLSFASKNSKNQTLLHLAYAWPKEFSVKRLVEQLMAKQVININAQDDDGRTVLHAAFEAYYNGAWYNRVSAEKLAIPSLLANPSLNPNIKDKNNQTPLGYISCTDSTSLIHLLFQHTNFNPTVADAENMPPLYTAYFLTKQAPYAHASQNDDRGVKINIKKFMHKNVMTKQLQLIPYITGEGLFGGWDHIYSWIWLDSLIKFCIKMGGSLTIRDECGNLPVDVACKQHKNHHRKNGYCYDEVTAVREEMTYHLYLLNTPDTEVSYRQISFYMRNFSDISQDVRNIISRFYYELILSKKVDKTVAQKINLYYQDHSKNRSKSRKQEYYHFSETQKAEYRKNIKEQLAITY